MIPIITTILICFFYVVIILYFYKGWLQLKLFSTDFFKPSIFTTVIVAVRNESANIGNLINDFQNQNFDKDFFEVLIVNDHSEDSTGTIVSQIGATCKNVFLLNLPSAKVGKKAAISFGIEKAKGQLIVTTDGDCRVGKEWLSTIVAYYEKNKSKMIFGPVFFQKENTIFNSLQSLEFSSLIASGAGAAGVNRPIMCNGANLAFEKTVFSGENNQLKIEKSSGDDVFLLHQIKKNNKNGIHFLKSEKAVVYTNAKNNLGAFFSQRIRWASKSKSYSDADSVVTAIVVFCMSAFLFGSFILGFYNSKYFFLFLGCFIVKSIADIFLVGSFLWFFKQQKLLLWYLPLQLIYFVYVTLIGIFGSFVQVNWKGRKVQ